MSTSGTYFERSREIKGTKRLWKLLAHIGKVVFALGLVLSATIALAETEVLVAKASHLSNADLVTMLSTGEGAF
jgi:hypothetical protein